MIIRRLVASTLLLPAVGLPAWAAGPDPHPPLPPLTYSAQVVDGRHLLADDPAGDGRRVQVLDELETARRVAVVVPGAGHDAAAFDEPLGPLDQARTLFDELQAQADDVPFAVVAWLGYDTPEGVDRTSARGERADVGARDLAALRAHLPADAEVTWVCHSYGAVVCTEAAASGTADRIVLLASPGAGAATVGGLGTTAEVWAARTPGDVIALVPGITVAGFGHGTDPTEESFGARRLHVGDARGQPGYYVPGNGLVAGLARVALGTAEVSRG